MNRLALTLLISGMSFTLASCASVPTQDQLVAGIDQTQLTQNATTKRTSSDPVCLDFYDNVGQFQQKAQASKGSTNFLSSLGLSVASALIVGQVVPSGINSQSGRLAAYAAAGTATSYGRGVAMRELNSSDRADAKIREVATNLGCPINVAR